MTKRQSRAFLPVVLIFAVITIFVLAGQTALGQWGMDGNVVLVGNTLLFLITCASYFIAQRGVHHTNPHAFVRAVYTGMMIKLFICIIAAFVYISLYRSNLNKPALFTCMGLYLVYTFVEVSILMQQLKEKTNE